MTDSRIDRERSQTYGMPLTRELPANERYFYFNGMNAGNARCGIGAHGSAEGTAVRVSKVSEESVFLAGQLQEGDLITGVRNLGDSEWLDPRMEHHYWGVPGTEVEIQVRRGDVSDVVLMQRGPFIDVLHSNALKIHKDPELRSCIYLLSEASTTTLGALEPQDVPHTVTKYQGRAV